MGYNVAPSHLSIVFLPNPCRSPTLPSATEDTAILMGRIARILTWTAAIVVGVPLLLVALLLVAGNIAPGQRLIARLVPSLTGGEIRIGGLSGRFPDRLRATTLTIDDPRGPYLTIQDLVLDWSPLELMHRTLAVDRLDVGAADFARMPESSGGKSSGLPVKVVLRQFEVGRLTIGAPVAGKQYVVAVQGAADLQSMSAGSGRLTVQQIGGSGRYSSARRHRSAALAGRYHREGTSAWADLGRGRAAGYRADQHPCDAGRPARRIATSSRPAPAHCVPRSRARWTWCMMPRT